MNTSVLRAVFARNYVSYFSNATGYLFICAFVLLSSFFAFWPSEFFNNNLANLDELNRWFPYIILIFIPAITMSAWAEERREGTDELLLTMPGNDLDVVLGKYAAAVAIYTVSLLFSMLTNYCVLQYLGNPDVGLFAATYLGYWFVGLALLAVGMVASFLTGNLTVAYVLGAVLGAPLVFAAEAGNVMGPQLAVVLAHWSIGQQMADFTRGVVSLTAIAYFSVIVVVMLYICMVLIGRRHWITTRGGAMAGHYLVRGLSLAVIAVGIVLISARYEVRGDVTQEKLTSLAPQSRAILANIKGQTDRVVRVDAFVSPEVPEDYVQTRLNLLGTLREIQALGGGKILVRVTDTRQFTEDASVAESRFKIVPRQVTTSQRGAIKVDQIFMGVAVRSGLNSVVIPFIDRGIPIEYELIRSIATVCEQKRKRLGVLSTDAPLYGRFNMQTMSSGGNWPIIDELEKQYEVIQVDASQPINVKDYDVLLAVQPSSLGPEQMDNFVAAVRAGLPTAIFEDPAPLLASGVPGTAEPRRPPGGMNMMMMGQQSPPKGDVEQLWRLLGVRFSPETVVWQDYNPYPKLADQFPPEFVFVENRANAEKGVNMRGFNEDDPVSSGLQQVLFAFPGGIARLSASPMEVEPLAETGTRTGTVAYREMIEMTPFGPTGRLNERRRAIPTGEVYIMAARIRGTVETPVPAPPKSDAAADKDKKPSTVKSQINVSLAADVDMLSPGIFALREKGDIPELGIYLQFDNVTFVLNALDALAGNNDYLEIRKRRRIHRTLTRIDENMQDARKETAKVRDEAIREFKQAQQREEEEFNQRLDKLKKEYQSKHLDQQEIVQKVQIAYVEGQKRMNAQIERLDQEKNRKIQQIEKQLAMKVRQVQDRYKMFAVLLPPIPPLVVAIFVFLLRRSREKEGVVRTRLK